VRQGAGAGACLWQVSRVGGGGGCGSGHPLWVIGPKAITNDTLCSMLQWGPGSSSCLVVAQHMCMTAAVHASTSAGMGSSISTHTNCITCISRAMCCHVTAGGEQHFDSSPPPLPFLLPPCMQGVPRGGGWQLGRLQAGAALWRLHD
jgi:hypothetical protein